MKYYASKFLSVKYQKKTYKSVCLEFVHFSCSSTQYGCKLFKEILETENFWRLAVTFTRFHTPTVQRKQFCGSRSQQVRNFINMIISPTEFFQCTKALHQVHSKYIIKHVYNIRLSLNIQIAFSLNKCGFQLLLGWPHIVNLCLYSSYDHSVYLWRPSTYFQNDCVYKPILIYNICHVYFPAMSFAIDMIWKIQSSQGRDKRQKSISPEIITYNYSQILHTNLTSYLSNGNNKTRFIN